MQELLKEEGVLERIIETQNTGIIRGERGKLLKGTAPLPGAGRPKVSRPNIAQKIWDRYTTDELLDRLDEAYRIAVSQRSPRGIVSATVPILEYGIGKPVQQVLVDAGRTELLEQLIADTDSKPLLPDAKEVAEVEVKAIEVASF